MYAVLKLSGSTTLALFLVVTMGTVVESEADEHLEWLISKIVWSLNNDMDSWVAQLVPVEDREEFLSTMEQGHRTGLRRVWLKDGEVSIAEAVAGRLAGGG